MKFKEVLITSSDVFSGTIFNVKKESVKLCDGSVADREVVYHNGGVCVIPFDGENVYMVFQYRRGVDESSIEFPAGKLENGEVLLSAAIRELKEETGIMADNVDFLCEIYPTPAYCSEKIYIFVATNLKFSSSHLDEGEFLDVLKIKLSELRDMILSGKIKDSKTIIGYYRLIEYIKASAYNDNDANL